MVDEKHFNTTVVDLRHAEWNGYSIYYNDIFVGDSQHQLLVNGQHEDDEYRMIRRHFGFDKPVLEFGGGLGCISVYINDQLPDDLKSEHYVCEPDPRLIPYIGWTGCANDAEFTLYPLPYGPTGETLTFSPENLGVREHDGDGVMDIPCAGLDKLVPGDGVVDVVMDAEGAEEYLVSHDLDVLSNRVHMLSVEAHPRFIDYSVKGFIGELEGVGFTLLERSDGYSASVLTFENQELGDEDG